MEYWLWQTTHTHSTYVRSAFRVGGYQGAAALVDISSIIQSLYKTYLLPFLEAPPKKNH